LFREGDVQMRVVAANLYLKSFFLKGFFLEKLPLFRLFRCTMMVIIF